MCLLCELCISVLENMVMNREKKKSMKNLNIFSCSSFNKPKMVIKWFEDTAEKQTYWTAKFREFKELSITIYYNIKIIFMVKDLFWICFGNFVNNINKSFNIILNKCYKISIIPVLSLFNRSEFYTVFQDTNPIILLYFKW